jgi:protein-S-isoprenylcysteine O-methyltransferase Ste14
VRSGQSALVTEEAEPGEWQRRFEESVAREDAKREADAAGCLAQLTDLRLWAAAILIPLGLAAAGLGWVATRLGWPRWVGLSAACLVAGAIACVLIARRMNSRRRGP